MQRLGAAINADNMSKSPLNRILVNYKHILIDVMARTPIRATGISLLVSLVVIFLSVVNVSSSEEQILELGKTRYDFFQLAPHITPKKSYSRSISGRKTYVRYLLEVSAEMNRCGHRLMRVAWTWNGDYKAKHPAGFRYDLTPLEQKIFYTIDFPRKVEDSVSVFNDLLRKEDNNNSKEIKMVDLNRFLEIMKIINHRKDNRIIAIKSGRILAKIIYENINDSTILDIEYNNPRHEYTVEVNFSEVPSGDLGLSCALRTAAELAAAIEQVKIP